MMSAGLGLSLGNRHVGTWWPVDALYAVEFPTRRYMKNDEVVSAGTAFSFSRASTKLAKNSDGVYGLFGSDEIAVTDLGALIQPELTYADVNSEMIDAALSSTFPTLWSHFTGGGLLDEITELGTISGLNFIKWRVFGTSSSASSAALRFGGASTIPAVQGQEWTNAAFIGLVAGSLATVNNAKLFLQEFAGPSLEIWVGPDVKSSITAVPEQFSFTQTMNNVATTHVRPHINTSFDSGEDIDFTLLVAAPTMTQTDYAPDPFPTDGSGVKTRMADQLTLHLPAGVQNLTLTYADNASEIVPSVSGDYLVPNDLNATPLVSVTSMTA